MADITQQWFLDASVGLNFNTMHIWDGDNDANRVYELNFSGGYIYRTDVKAFMVDNATQVRTDLDVTFIGDNTVTLSAAVPLDSKVTIFRDTNKVLPLAQFTDGAIITAGNLDRNAKQAVFASAEMVDRFESVGPIVGDAISIAQEAKDIAEEALENSQNSGGEANTEALRVATEARTIAQASNNTANSALTTSNNAMNTANLALIEAGTAASAVSNQLAGIYGFSHVGGSQSVRMTLAQAKAYTGFTEGLRVFVTDLGFTYKFTASRNIVPGHSISAAVLDDEVHKMVSAGGMLEFDDYGRLSQIESQNYSAYLAKVRTNAAIGLVCYGDSITWGQRPDGGQFPNNYPAQIVSTMSSRTQSSWTVANMASPGDTALVNYRRTMADGQIGDVSTIMLGVNDIKTATNNGNTPEGIVGSTLYGVKNYALVMRKFVARELLRGRCVLVLGTTQWVGGANLSPLGGYIECYLSDAYDGAARTVAEQFGCMFVDTMQDVIKQFGISESCHDGVHLREDFLPIIGKRFAAVFLHQDYKNPCKLKSGDVFIPNYFFNPVSSNRTIQRNTFTNGSSPPLGGGVLAPEAVGVMLPNMAAGGSVTFAFYVDTDSLVIYPTLNADSAYSFDLILDDGATQPDYPSDVEIIPVLRDRQYIVSGRSVSGSTKKSRTTEKYSVNRVNGCYMHVTTRGWHTLTFAMGANAGDVAVEGLVCDSWSNVKNNDVFGGVSGAVYYKDAVAEVTGFLTTAVQVATGVYDVSMSNLVPENYRVHVECTEDVDYVQWRLIFKAEGGFRLHFYDKDNVLVDPTSFRATVIGGR
ncbi:tail fiber protein [Pectobacterium phage PP2]|uniref:Tail fiber protein n=1 Tax=Pectobacterium phage PP2 TaxID=1897743 RepID=A0A1W5P518_9CAUD|nr:tail fiber protein [Pectobacterium phage PP2]AOT25406.1 tail fiber protein [Pectobacterium phage PP2]